MKFLNLSAITLIALFSVSGCSNNNDPTPGDNSTVALVKTITSDGAAFATLSYSTQGQLTSMKYAGSGTISGGNPGIKFTYDPTGRLIKAVSDVDSTQYSYGIDGNLQQSDTFTEWKLSKDGSGMDFRNTFSYGNGGRIVSMSVSDGTKAAGQTQRYVVNYDYGADGGLSGLTYKYGSDAGQKFVVENGYTDAVKLNPLILERTTSLSYYFGLAGIVQLTGKFPKTIRNYDNGQVLEGYGFNFDITNGRVNKMSTLLKLPNSESTINYEFQY